MFISYMLRIFFAFFFVDTIVLLIYFVNLESLYIFYIL